MSDLSDKVKKDFTEFSKRNKYIQELIKKFENGKATLSEVDAITGATGYALKVALEKNITENTAAFANAEELAEILRDTFGDNYEMINAVAADVQKRLDKAQGINIRPQKADFPAERVENLAKFAAGKDLTDKKAVSEFGAAVENLNNSMYTDYVKANADFRSKAGLKVYVIRTDHGGCCEWCAKRAGKYVYPDVPKDVWRRHKRCTCEITYVNERAGTYDRISFHDSIDPEDSKKLVTNKQITKLTPEQAAAKEREILERKPLKRLTPKQAKATESEVMEKYYTKKQLDNMPLEDLRHETAKLAGQWYASGKSGISFGGNDVYRVAQTLSANASRSALTKDYMSIKKELSKLDKAGKSGIIKENIVIGRSVGAAGKNYPVKLPSGNHAKIVEGTEITGIKAFAGKGTDTPIRVAKQLEDKYKIKAEKWEKVRGTAYIRENGTNRKVEIHWYEADGERVEMKVKRYFDED